MCQNAGIAGYRTNHSLRATAATRLYQAAVDEQLIMERTGHRSIEGVRSYKRTTAAQQQGLSDVLNGTRQDLSVVSTGLNRVNPAATPGGVVMNKSESLTTNVIHNPPAFNFQSCSVTIINNHSDLFYHNNYAHYYFKSSLIADCTYFITNSHIESTVTHCFIVFCCNNTELYWYMIPWESTR